MIAPLLLNGKIGSIKDVDTSLTIRERQLKKGRRHQLFLRRFHKTGPSGHDGICCLYRFKSTSEISRKSVGSWMNSSLNVWPLNRAKNADKLRINLDLYLSIPVVACECENLEENPLLTSLFPSVSKRFQSFQSGAAVGIRTPNLLIRSQMLYPIELRLRVGLVKMPRNLSFVKSEITSAQKISPAASSKNARFLHLREGRGSSSRSSFLCAFVDKNPPLSHALSG